MVGLKQRLVVRSNGEMRGIGMMKLMEFVVVKVMVVGSEIMRIGWRR